MIGLEDRIALASEIRTIQPAVADANVHLDFLRGAVESGSRESFGEYVRWAARMLDARRMGPEHMAQNLEQIRDVLIARLTNPNKDVAAQVLDYGAQLARTPLEADALPQSFSRRAIRSARSTSTCFSMPCTRWGGYGSATRSQWLRSIWRRRLPSS